MNRIPISLFGLVLLAPIVSVRAASVTLIGKEADHGWSLADDFEGLSYYGSTGVSGVNYVSTPLSVLGGLGTLSYSAASGGLAVYGNPPIGAGPAGGSGIPASSADYPAFVVNGGYAGVGPSGSKALGADSSTAELLIQFTQEMNAVGFYATGDKLAVTLFDVNGLQIDSSCSVIGMDNNLEFWGWQSSTGIGSVKLSGDYIAFDRLLADAVPVVPPPPTPSEVPEVAVVAPAMAALLVGAELIRRRRK